jgi:hypothetical protein
MDVDSKYTELLRASEQVWVGGERPRPGGPAQAIASSVQVQAAVSKEEWQKQQMRRISHSATSHKKADWRDQQKGANEHGHSNRQSAALQLMRRLSCNTAATSEQVAQVAQSRVLQQRRLSATPTAVVSSPLDNMLRKTSIAHRRLSITIQDQARARQLLNNSQLDPEQER